MTTYESSHVRGAYSADALKYMHELGKQARDFTVVKIGDYWYANTDKLNRIDPVERKTPPAYRIFTLRGLMDYITADPDSLLDQYARLVLHQERMKEVNAYFRKHKTLDGCASLTTEQIERLKASMSNAWHSEAPFPSFQLSNNNAEIRRIEKRIKEITETKTAGDRSYPAEGVEGLQVVEDTGIMRIQLVFEGKPDAPVRDILKTWGFRWAPSQNAWQRLLNQNGRYAAQMAIEKIAAMKQ